MIDKPKIVNIIPIKQLKKQPLKIYYFKFIFSKVNCVITNKSMY